MAAASRARAPARRSGPDLVTVGPGAARGVFRGDARGPHPRPARSPHEHRRDRRRRRPRRAPPPDPRHRPRRTRPGSREPRRVPDDHDRHALGRAGSGDVPARLGGPARCLAAAEAGGRLGPDLHVGHDRQPEGRHGRPRQPARDARRDRPRHPAARPPDPLGPAPQPPVRAGDRPDLRPVRRSGHPLRPKPQPAHSVRGPPESSGHEHDPRAPGPRSLLERDRARGRTLGPCEGVRAPAADRPPPPVSRAAPDLPERPSASRRRPQPVRLLRRVPAAGAPAGVGGHRRRRHPGLRQLRERVRDVHDPRGPWTRDGRPADATGRAPDRRRRGGPVPRPDPVQGLLAGRRVNGGRDRPRRLVPHRRHRPSRP